MYRLCEYLCFAQLSNLIIISKDGKPLSINRADPEMTEVEFPDDFLSKVFVGRCSYDFNNGCSSPEGRITDFNIWDRFLSTEQLIEWTTCK